MWQQLFKLREGLNSETWTILILKHFSELARVSNNSHERAALLKQSGPNRVLIRGVHISMGKFQSGFLKKHISFPDCICFPGYKKYRSSAF